MAAIAKLYADDRAAARRAVSLDATLRDAKLAPTDVIIEDLSLTGFRMTADAELPIGSVIGIGMSGVARRDARIVRRAGSLYGCAFLTPISDSDHQRAQEADTVVAATFGAFESRVTEVMPAEEDLGKLPAPIRLLAIIGSTVVLWGIIVAIIRVLL